MCFFMEPVMYGCYPRAAQAQYSQRKLIQSANPFRLPPRALLPAWLMSYKIDYPFDSVGLNSAL